MVFRNDEAKLTPFLQTTILQMLFENILAKVWKICYKYNWPGLYENRLVTSIDPDQTAHLCSQIALRSERVSRIFQKTALFACRSERVSRIFQKTALFAFRSERVSRIFQKTALFAYRSEKVSRIFQKSVSIAWMRRQISVCRCNNYINTFQHTDFF